MAWETRAGAGPYYTRSRKVGGRVVREYVGRGPLAELIAADDAAQRAERAAAAASRQAQRAILAAADAPLVAFSNVLDGLAAATLTTAGYHRHHRGEWRRRRVSAGSTGTSTTLGLAGGVEQIADGQVPVGMILSDLMRQADEGDRNAMELVARVLDAGHGAWEAIADLGLSAERAWLDLAAGEQVLLREALRRKLASLKTEVAGPAATSLEQLLAERIAVCWLAVQEADHVAARFFREGGTQAEARFVEERQERAQRRYLAAVKALAQVRRLVTPVVQLNVAGRQVNIAR